MDIVQQNQTTSDEFAGVRNQLESCRLTAIQTLSADKIDREQGSSRNEAEQVMPQSVESAESTARVQLKLLGGLQINRGSTPLTLTARKSQLVLAYLAVARRKQERRDTLAMLFWENAELEQARSSLRQSLSRLRRTLQDDTLIWADGLSIGLHPEAWDIDLDTLFRDDDGVDQDSDMPMVGKFLQGLVFRENSITQWLDSQRQRTQEQMLSHLQRRIENAIDQRRYAFAIQSCLQALTGDPLRESVHRLLMQAHHLNGDSAMAIRQFKSLRRKLDVELQVPPETQTIELVERIGRARRTNNAPDPAPRLIQPVQATASTCPKSGKPTAENERYVHTREDWDDDVDPESITGREDELATLDQWILKDRCKLVALLGMGGIGKSSCAMKFARTRQGDFDVVCWKTLRNTPSLDTLLSELIPSLSNHTDASTTLARFRYWCQHTRCLIVLDNAESILQPSSNSGDYLPGYEGYGEFLRIAGSANHKSCVILTSREKPVELATQESSDSRDVRSLQLSGALDIAQALQRSKGLMGSDVQLQSLYERYSGNPLALKIVMTTILELFEGDLGAFLAEEVTVYNSIRRLLAQQYARQSTLEQSLMLWLAIHRDWTTLQQLAGDIYPQRSTSELLGSIESLLRRSLIEVSNQRYRLQSVVLEFVVAHFIDSVVSEIVEQTPRLVASHALVKTSSPEHVRSSQRRLVLTQIVERLQSQLRLTADQPASITSFLDTVRENELWRNAYTGGNLLNLLAMANQGNVTFDFSKLTLRDVDLRNLHCREANCSDATFIHPSMTQAFGGVQTIACSPDGRLMASSHSSLDVYVWSMDSLQPVLRLPHTDWTRAVRFSPDGSLLATGGDDSTLRLWRLPSGTLERRFSISSGRISSVEFSTDGRILFSASEDGCIRRWDCSGGDYLAKLEAHSGQLWFMTASTDGRYLASGGDDLTIRIWDTKSDRCLHVLNGHEARVTSACFSPDGATLASAGHDCTVRLWSVETGTCLAALSGHKHWILSLAFDRDGRLLATGSEDRQVRIWHVPPGDAEKTECIRIIDAHSNKVGAVAFATHADVLFSGSEDQSIRLWDMKPVQAAGSDSIRVSADCLKRLQGHNSQVWSVKVSSDETHVISCGDDPELQLWNLATGHCEALFRGHSQRVKSVSISSDNQTIASASEDQTARLWHRDTGRCFAVLQGHDKQVWDVSFSPDGRYLATASEDQTVRVWDVFTSECLQVLEGHDNWVWDVAFSPDGNSIASSSFDCTVRLWNWRNGRCCGILKGHQGAVMESSFSHDGSLLASTSLYDQTVRLWDAKTGDLLESLANQHAATIEFAPASSVTNSQELLAIGTRNGLLRLWNIRTHSLWQELAGHNPQFWISSVSFAPSGAFVMTSSGDQTVRQWNLHTGTCAQVLEPARPYQRLAISGATGLSEAQVSDMMELGAVR